MDDHSLAAIVSNIETRVPVLGASRALSAYLNVLAGLAGEDDFNITQTTAYLIERCAETAIWCGHRAVATKMLWALQLKLKQANNLHGADIVGVKCLHLAVSAGDRAGIRTALDTLAVTIGDFYQIDFSAAGLARFEEWCTWPVADNRERRRFFALFLLEAGRLLLWLGRFSDARTALERSLIHASDPTFTPDLVGAVRQELANLHLACGNLTQASAQLEAATSTPIAAYQIGLRARQAELLGHAATLGGDLAGARRAYEACQQLCQEQGLGMALQRNAMNLAHLLIVMNQTLGAEEVLLRARSSGDLDVELEERLVWLEAIIHARRTAGLFGPSIAPSNASLWEMPEAPQAAADIRPAYRPLGLASASLLERLADYTLEFYDLLDRRQFARADELLAHIRLVFGGSDSTLILCRVAMLEALPVYFRGNYREAAAQLEPVCASLQQMGLHHDQWLAGSVRLWCLMRLGAPCESLRKQTHELLARMASGLTDAERAVFELNKWDEYELEFKSAIDGLQVVRSKAVAARWPQRLALAWKWRSMLDALVRALDGRRTRMWSATEMCGRPWWRRIFAHGSRDISVSYLVLPDRVFVVREGLFHFEFDVLPVTRLRLREIVRTWHACMADPSAKPDATDYCSEELGRHLQIAGWLSRRKPKHLRLVADDVLHGFPFAALRFEGRFLVDRLALSHDITHMRPAKPRKLPRARRALVAGVALALDGNEPLPNVTAEADAVASLLRSSRLQVTLLEDRNAGRSAVVEALLSAQLAHLACHGVFHRDDLNGTGLLLPPGAPEGLLSLREIADMPLRGLRHITLSSCWSADNYLLPGRAIVSLPHALRQAGASSVLSSLWKVDDAVSRTFSARFYDLCRTLAPPQALQQTQAELLGGTLRVGGSLAVNPYFWAGFVAHCAPYFSRRRLLGRLRL